MGLAMAGPGPMAPGSETKSDRPARSRLPRVKFSRDVNRSERNLLVSDYKE